MDEALPPLMSIGAVERDTGLSKDTLRIWERRYGFPAPIRDASGERLYPEAQVFRLRVIKRLLDAGHRAGRVVTLDLEALERLSSALGSRAEPAVADDGPVERLLGLLKAHDLVALRGQLRQLQLELGLSRFVIDVVAPLTTRVGESWMRGHLQVFEEHLYTELVQNVLRAAVLAAVAGSHADRPRVLLATVPGEPHGLGLLMAEALLVMQGANCLALGTQTPLWDISLAAQGHDSDVVALSFTGCMPPNRVVEALEELRAKLPSTVEIWAGGSAPVLHRRPVEGVLALGALQELAPSLERWRRAASA